MRKVSFRDSAVYLSLGIGLFLLADKFSTGNSREITANS